MIRFYLLLFFAVLTLSPEYVAGQTFQPTGHVFASAYEGPVRWADLDNDNDLDLIYSGFSDEGANDFITKVYENVNGAFVERVTDLPNIRNGQFEFGDIDDDGDLDVAIAGLASPSDQVCSVYRNNGGFSFTFLQSLGAVINPGMSWVDIDNDHDLDFLVAGLDIDDNSEPMVIKTFFYENEGGSLSLLLNTNLPDCEQCSFDWADVNGDGLKDLLAVGGDGDSDELIATIFLNNGDKTFTQDVNADFSGAFNGTGRFGDYDNDGDLDVLLCGYVDNNTAIGVIYENTGSGWVAHDDLVPNLVSESWRGSLSWADLNNDERLDIIISGRESGLAEKFYFKMLKNTGTGFEEIATNVFDSDNVITIDAGDYDNDGDIDIAYMALEGGVNRVIRIADNTFISGSAVANTEPVAPTSGFREKLFADDVILTWDPGSDSQTAEGGLTYNIKFRNSSTEVIVPSADATTGYLKTLAAPNGQGRMSKVSGLTDGETYFWSVQTIDGAKVGSPFSAEQSFVQFNGPDLATAVIVDPQNVRVTWRDNSSSETNYRVDRSIDELDNFTPVIITGQNSNSYLDNFVFDTDRYYYYRVKAYNASQTSGYDSAKVLIPTPPSGLAAASLSVSRMRLTWQDNSAYENGYVVERKISGSPTFETVATLPANTASYTDTDLEEGVTYDYRVYATIEYGNSDYSNLISEMTNRRPIAMDGVKETLEDTSVNFEAVDFNDAFSDDDGDLLSQVRIESLPGTGVLKLDGEVLSEGDVVEQDELSTLTYEPETNFFGAVSFMFFVNDGKDYASMPTQININVIPVNDPPVVADIEDQQLELSIPSAEVIISASDVDNPLEELSWSFTTGNSALVKPSDISVEEVAGLWIMTIKHQPFEVGETIITATVSDGELTDNETFVFTVTPVTAIVEQLDGSKVKLSPNPSENIVNVTLPPEMQAPFIIEVIDGSGKHVDRQSSVEREFTLDTSAMHAGVYLVKMVSGNGKSVVTRLVRR